MLPGMVTFIGDVHGWSDRLDQVVSQAEGHLVFVGDLIDRGPDAPGVIHRVRELCASGRATCLMGNHEYALVRGLGVPALGIPEDPLMFAAWAAGYGGNAVLKAYNIADNPVDLRDRLGDALEWMATLPWVLEGGDGGRSWIAVHAGLSTKPLAPQLEELRHPADWLRSDEAHQPPA